MVSLHAGRLLLTVLVFSIFQCSLSLEQEEDKDVGKLQYLSGFGFGSIGKRAGRDDTRSKLADPRFELYSVLLNQNIIF